VADAQSFLRGMLLLVGAVAAGAILLVRRLLTGVTAPLAEMTTAAEAMAAGNYTVRVATNRDDEIGRLGRAFNAMTGDVARELAARNRALDLLRASEGRYRTLFDYAPDGILIADSEGRYLDANPGICRMLGYERDQLVGLQATDVVAPEETVHIEPALTAIGARTDYHREWRFRRRDGSTFDAEVIATQMPDGNILAMIRDITDRNKAVEAVRAAEERMRFALESADVGIWEMDFRTGEVRWSEILEAQYGLAAGAFGGTFDAFVALVHPDDRAGVRRAVDDATRKGGEFTLQHRIVRPDGRMRWISGAGQVLLGPDRSPLRAVGISLDETARQTLEAQFQQAQKMEAIGRLAGGVAHDFNNLLTAILGYCELVLDDLRPDDPLRFEIAEIDKAGRRAADLTRQLLAFSRKQIIEPTLLDVNEVVHGLQSLLQRLISEDVEIVFALDERPMVVTADRGQIEQVVMNLAVNARDAMPSGGRLTIETAHVELDDTYAATHFQVTPGAYVALTLTDTGAGMTADVLAHLFEPFFTTKEAGKGTGLGLATVHGIVTRSGGSVGVYSEPGRGTSFKVYLPRADASVAAEEPAAPAAQLHGEGRTVLVVDDAEGLRLLMSRTLARQGFEVLLAANAAEALRLVEGHPTIDVLLTDVVMPGASGPELTADLQARRSGLKVIYMSGYTEDAIVHHGVLKPGIAFLHKPFTAHALGQKIHEVLGG
jgi:PAS domain S-box-containing protein